MEMHYLNYKSHKMELARKLAKTSSSPGDLAAAADIPFSDAYKLWWGTINQEAIREKGRGFNADEI